MERTATAKHERHEIGAARDSAGLTRRVLPVLPVLLVLHLLCSLTYPFAFTFSQLSFNVTVRLNTSAPGAESGSLMK